MNWKEEAKLKARDALETDLFGATVSVDNDVIAVGLAGFYNLRPVYIYRFDGAMWAEEARLEETQSVEGESLSVDKDVVAFGDIYAATVYIYRFDGTTWVREAEIVNSDFLLTASISVSGDLVVVGAHNDDENGERSGSAYVFRFDGTNWIEDNKLTASDGATYDVFGASVSVSGETIAVGASGADAVGINSGAAYIFGTPCREATINYGIILNSLTPKRDAFSINLEGSTTSLADMLADFDTKTVHIQVGPLELDIPGNLFVRLPNGDYAFRGSITGSSEYFLISLNPNGRARLRGIRTNLDGITNPIPVSIGIDSVCWRSSVEWRETTHPGGVIYRFQ